MVNKESKGYTKNLKNLPDISGGFSSEQEAEMIKLGIEKGVCVFHEKATLPHLKYQWKSIVDKYEIWKQLNKL